MSIDEQFVQVELQSVAPDKNLHQVCWLPYSKLIRLGLKISLEDERSGWVWEIIKVYPEIKPRHRMEKSWKVGGLS